MSDAEQKREGLCQICKQEYPVWIAPNDLWNKVMRHADGTDVYNFVCPTCFAKEAEAMGIIPTAWCLTEEKPTHPVDSKLHESVGIKPVDGELREKIDNLLYKFADYIRHHADTGLGGPDNQTATTQAIIQLFAAHLQAAVREAEDTLRLPIPYVLHYHANDTWSAIWEPAVPTIGLPKKLHGESGTSPYKAVQRLREKAEECGLLQQLNQGDGNATQE